MKKLFRCMLITGCKNDKWPSFRLVNKVISIYARTHGYNKDGYIITGASREVEKKVVRACKLNKVRVLIVPANFEMLTGNSAEQLRNDDVLHTFKPESVVVFIDGEKLANLDEYKDSVIAHLIKVARRAKLDVVEECKK